MSELPEPATGERTDRFLQALRAAEELEKFGFDLNALSDDQIEQLSQKFALSPEQRGRLRAALALGLSSSQEPC